MLNIKTLENWLWEADCKIHGEIDAPKYKDYILPLIFLKRLSDVFDDEVESFTQEIGDRQKAENPIDKDHSIVRFYLPKETRWNEIAKFYYGAILKGEFLYEIRRPRKDKKLPIVLSKEEVAKILSSVIILSIKQF